MVAVHGGLCVGSSFPGRECGAHDITLSPTGLRVQEGVGACVEGQNRDVAYTDSVTERCLCSCLCAVVCVLLPVHFRAMSLEQQPPKKFAFCRDGHCVKLA